MSDPIPPQRTPEASGSVLSAEELTRLKGYAAGYACCRRVRGDHEDCRTALHDPADWCEPCITSRLLAHVEAREKGQHPFAVGTEARYKHDIETRDIVVEQLSQRLAQAEAALHTCEETRAIECEALQSAVQHVSELEAEMCDTDREYEASLAQSAERIAKLETAIGEVTEINHEIGDQLIASAERIQKLESALETVERIADTADAEMGDERNSMASRGVYEWAERNLRAALAGASPVPPQATTRVEMLRQHLAIMRDLHVRPELLALVEQEIAASEPSAAHRQET